MADDNPLGYGGADSGFFDWKSSPQGPGAQPRQQQQQEDFESEEIDSAKAAFEQRQKFIDEAHGKWDEMEVALKAQRERFFEIQQRDKQLKPPTPMAHPAPPDITPEQAQELQRAGIDVVHSTLPMTVIGGVRNRNSSLPTLLGGLNAALNPFSPSFWEGPKARREKFAEAYTQWRAIDKYVSEYNEAQDKSYKEALANQKTDKADQLEAIKVLSDIYKDPYLHALAEAGEWEKSMTYIDKISQMEARRKRGVTNLDEQAYKLMSGDQKFKEYAGMIHQKTHGRINLMDEAQFQKHWDEAAEIMPFQEFEGQSNPDKETGKSKHPELESTPEPKKPTADDLHNILGGD